MPRTKYGNTVKIHVTGRLEDGTAFETTINRDPLAFTVGGGQVIPALEEAVIGVRPGEWKTVEAPADKAYGPHQREKVLLVPRRRFRSPAREDKDDPIVRATVT